MVQKSQDLSHPRSADSFAQPDYDGIQQLVASLEYGLRGGNHSNTDTSSSLTNQGGVCCNLEPKGLVSFALKEFLNFGTSNQPYACRLVPEIDQHRGKHKQKGVYFVIAQYFSKESRCRGTEGQFPRPFLVVHQWFVFGRRQVRTGFLVRQMYHGAVLRRLFCVVYRAVCRSLGSVSPGKVFVDFRKRQFCERGNIFGHALPLV